MLQYFAVCCSVLRFVAADTCVRGYAPRQKTAVFYRCNKCCCSNVAVCCIVLLQYVAMWCRSGSVVCCSVLLQCVAMLCCSELQCVAVCCDLLRQTHGNTLQHTATHCNTLQHTATHCNTQIITSLTASLIPVCNAFLIMLLVTSIYAILGVNFYSTTSPQVLQCVGVAVCCSVLHCVATRFFIMLVVMSIYAILSVNFYSTTSPRVLQCVVVCCSVLQCVVVCCSVLQRVF